MIDKNSIIFGPVQSRRLGSSLGLDLVSAKTCSLDCVYCECGKTTNLTNERREYISADKIIADLDVFLQNGPPHIDVITFGGSGEPLLNSGIGKIILHIKKTYPQFNVAVLTNSISLIEKKVREEILAADFVLPSVDAFFEKSFQTINRPANGVTINFVLNGLCEFAKIYKGTLWVEYFVVSGINDSEEEVLALKRFFEKINPTKIQLNSLDRPGTCEWVKAAAPERLREIKNMLQPLSVEIISRNFDDKMFDNRILTGKFISRRDK